MSRWVVKTETDYEKARRELVKKFRDLPGIIREAAATEIMGMLADVLEVSLPRTPLEEGSLRESGHATIDGVPFARGQIDGSVIRYDRVSPKLQAKKYTYEVGYWVEGGGTGREGDVNKYAWVQHEHVEFHHEHGQAKFFETAVIEEQAKWRQRLAEALRDATREV